jgi:hypothetical protein
VRAAYFLLPPKRWEEINDFHEDILRKRKIDTLLFPYQMRIITEEEVEWGNTKKSGEKINIVENPLRKKKEKEK